MSLVCARTKVSLLVLLALVATLLTLPGGASAGPERDLVAVGEVPIDPALAEDLANLPKSLLLDAFVHFHGGAAADQRAHLEDRGLRVVRAYEQLDAAYVWGSVAELRGLTRDPLISYLEANRTLSYQGDTAGWATRAEVARNSVLGGPYRDGGGNLLDGSGVGVAIVDSGMDGTHPDLDTRIGANYKIVCTTPGLINVNTQQCFGPLAFVDVGSDASTDASSGHGTHVSGIVAGEGEASDGTFKGVAPGATLYGYSTGEVISVLYATEAFQHILDNYDTFVPQIRVINNSWGDDPAENHNPNSVLSKLVDLLVDKGVTFTFAAGNSGAGNGSQDRTSSFCKDPRPGVICVANYSDANTGSISGGLSSTSSRGNPGEAPDQWPDISAPGSSYISTCRPSIPLCATGPTPAWQPFYASLSGTSMASPHVAGTAALLYQADSTISPAEIEDVLQDTARKLGGAYVSDPQNPDGTIRHDFGAGLMHVHAALDALGIAHDGSGGGGGSTDPSINVTSPGQDEVFDGSSTIPVAGTAFDGTSSSSPSEHVIVASDDEGGLVQPGALDMQRVTTLETASGMEYRITVRNASDRAPNTNASFRITQNVEGSSFLSNVVLPPSGPPTPSGSGAGAPTSASLEGNTIVMSVPFANLGNPGPNSAAHNVFASAFIGGIVDVAPGGPGADVITKPRYGAPYDILRPDGGTTPVATVGYSVDGDLEQTATVSGSSPNYTWSDGIDPTLLSDGPHTVTATLYLNGVPGATDTTSFAIERTQSHSYDVLMTSPADGSEVPRALVEIRGTSSTDDPSGIEQVTVRITDAATGGATYDSGELTANGTAPWAKDFDFGDLTEGSYSVTARAYSGGSEVATHTITVHVPAEGSGEVSCAGRGLGFWREQFSDNGGSQHFTDDEAQQLAEYAARLSDGYFEDGAELVNTLNAKGNKNDELRAARHYAALLLNLAGGDLSSSMSTQVGLSGDEMLDPAVYDTATIGSTVDEAADWAGNEFRTGGDFSGAGEVSEAINEGVGLLC